MLSVQNTDLSIEISKSLSNIPSIFTAMVAAVNSNLGIVFLFIGASLDLASRNAQLILPFSLVYLRYETVPYPVSDASEK